MSAREANRHDPQLLVQLQMLQMIFEDSKCIYIGLCIGVGWIGSGGGVIFQLCFCSVRFLACKARVFVVIIISLLF